MTETKTDEYKKGYREGFLDGFHAARDNDSLMSPNIPIPTKCKICGLDISRPMGYVCGRSDCGSLVKNESNNQVLTMDSFKWY